MKINNKLVKLISSIDISMLTEQERLELAKEVDNESVAEVAAQEAQDWLDGHLEDKDLIDPDDINDGE